MLQADLIECFQDTWQMSHSNELGNKTEKAIRTQKVYKEYFQAKRRRYNDNAGEIMIQENTSFAAAQNYLEYGRVAVLNFANPVNPGGGVCNGAMAQEECLCRSSNLYAAISDKNVSEEYYEYHKAIGNDFYSDRLIYTPGITVFKTDDTLPVTKNEEFWFDVDVITCAAPYVAKKACSNKDTLLKLFQSRIKNIFEAAIENNVNVLILGAFGCGAFKNPPDVVAKAFYNTIAECRYDKCINKIVFAIKRSVLNMDEICPNIRAFEKIFGSNEDLYKLNVKIMTGVNDSLALIIKSSGKSLTFKKSYVGIGKDKNCDVCLENRYISRRQAVFLYEKDNWFIVDNDSTNGTWLNGIRLEPNVKYQLKYHDIIDFAHSEIAIIGKVENSNQDKPEKEEIEVFAKLEFYEEDNANTTKVQINWNGKVISDRYQVLREIGGGGVCRTYMAMDNQDHRIIDMKIMDKKAIEKNGNVYFGFMQHVRMMMQLQHIGIPRFYDVIEDENFVYVIREHLEGIILDDILRNSGPQPQETVVRWAVKISEILMYLHNMNPSRIHRDIRPSNLILTPDGNIKIIDFGIMRIYDPKAIEDDGHLGTQGYAAPEQYGGRGQTDARTDIYALGVTMHQLLTGSDPQKYPYEIQPIRKWKRSFSKRLEKIILKCTEVDRSKRFQNCKELIAALNKCNFDSGGIGTFNRLFAREKTGNRIVKFDISFGDYLGKSITFKDKKLFYKNSISPTIGYMTFPKGYFDVKIKVLKKSELNEILDFVDSCGYKSWISDPDANMIAVGANYQIFRCVYEDGSVFEYKTRMKPVQSFITLTEFVRKYCEFIT